MLKLLSLDRRVSTHNAARKLPGYMYLCNPTLANIILVMISSRYLRKSKRDIVP
jgi:hypothetical protein